MNGKAALLLCLWILCLALVPGSLRAGNLEKFTLGEDAGLSAGAVAATSAGAASIYYNPAGLALLEADSVDLGVSAYAARYYRIPNLVQVKLPDGSGHLDFEGTSFFSTPAAVIFGSRLGPDLGVAFAVLTRDQLDLSGVFSQAFSGRNGSQPYNYEQGVQLDFRSKDYLAGLGLGWQAARKTRLGLSVLGEYSHQAVRTQFWGDYSDPSTYNPSTQLYATRLTTSNQQTFGSGVYGLRSIAGLQWQPLDALSLGLVARSPLFAIYSENEADIMINGAFVPAAAVIQYHGIGNTTTHPYVWGDVYRVEGGAAWTGDRGWISAQVDASDRPDDEGRGVVWNYKLGGIVHLNSAWDWGAGAYTDLQWHEPLAGFAANNVDYYGANTGLRWRRQIGADPGKPGAVELRSSLMLHYERGYGELAGAGTDALNPQFPPPVAKTNAVFEEANVHLASSLLW